MGRDATGRWVSLGKLRRQWARSLDASLRADSGMCASATGHVGTPSRKSSGRNSTPVTYAFALISVAAVLDVKQGRIQSARCAFGGLAPKPWRSRGAEAALVGRVANHQTFQTAADAALQRARGHGHNDFKIALTKRTLIASLIAAAGLERT